MGKFDRALQLIKEIVEFAESGDYIFRGEDECYSQIKSKLYRDHKIENVVTSDASCETDNEKHDLRMSLSLTEIAKEMLEKYKSDLFPASVSNIEVLTEIQHYGGKTLLIDFSKNVFIALYFACAGKIDTDGRLIFLEKTQLVTIKDVYSDNESTKKLSLISPYASNNRVLSQRSLFVHAPIGFIKDEMVNIKIIDHTIKKEVLDYLKKYYDIDFKTIFQDVYGYIENEEKFKSSIFLFLEGNNFYNKGEFGKAIQRYTESIEEGFDKWSVYKNRGQSYYNLREMALALKDYEKAIEIIENTSNDPLLLIEPKRMIGVILDDTNKHEDAINMFKDLINTLQQRHNQNTEIAKLNYDIGLSHERWGKSEEKNLHYREAIDFYKKSKDLGYSDQELLDGKIKKLDEEMQNMQMEPEK